MRLSLDARFALVLGLLVLATSGAALWVFAHSQSITLALLTAALVSLIGGLLAARHLVKPAERLLRAMESAVASYRDGDFSVSITSQRSDVLGDLSRQHNALSRILREERQHLVQRELLLDTVVQNTPVALILVDDLQRVAYSNLAARQLFNDNRSLNGLDFQSIVDAAPPSLRDALAETNDALFSVNLAEGEETFHLSQRGFRLQGRQHRLYLFRRMTRELSRQEVATWKKVIRVLSHELNNTLAPMSSMAHSGRELLRRERYEQLPGVLQSIAERAAHLHQFMDGYAQFARLPAPRCETLDWAHLVAGLQGQIGFQVLGELPRHTAHLDAVQLERVLLNLLKNAHEAGSPADCVALRITHLTGQWKIDVLDRGDGMNDTVLSNALLPFYSTKRAGTGLGLALAREIVEAHGGHIQLSNRDGGGLRVTLLLPDQR